MAKNRVIGRGGQLPWHLPDDLKWFKKLTSGGTVVMGRKTWQSLPRKPLPGRQNIVLSRTLAPPPDGATLARSIDELDSGDSTWLIGGADLYHQLLPRCTDLYLTLVNATPEGDALFPPFETRFELVAVLDRQESFEMRHYRNRHVASAPPSPPLHRS